MKNNYSFISMIKRYVNTSGVLIVMTILALIVANSPLKDEYFRFWQQEVTLSIGSFNLFNHNDNNRDYNIKYYYIYNYNYN